MNNLLQRYQKVRIDNLCEFIRGVNFDKSEVSSIPIQGYLPILRAGNIKERLDLENDLIWVPAKNISSTQKLQTGDIAVCMSSGSASVVGKTAQLNSQWEGSVGAFCGIIRPRDVVISDYLAFWFRSCEFIKWRNGQARGANIQNLRFSQIVSLEIPLPPLPEQKHIAAILNEQMAAVEKARAAAEAQLEAAKTLPSAYLRSVFNSPEAQKWPKKTLGEVFKVKSGEFLPAKTMHPNGQYPVYGGNGINGYHDKFMFEEQKIVIGRVGAYCGCIHLSQPKSWITDNALYISSVPTFYKIIVKTNLITRCYKEK